MIDAIKEVGMICAGSKSKSREAILKYERVAEKMPQVDIPVTHHLHGGMYGREINIPAGTVITGQIYKFDHFDIMIEGDITVSTDTDEPKRFTGFNLFKGMSGKKRAGYAHKDTRWITFHPFSSENGDEVQSFVTAESFEDLAEFYISANRADYFNFVSSTGLTEGQILSQVNNKDDQIDDKDFSVYVSESDIQGLGLYTFKNILAGEEICMARINGMRTRAGRYTNHAVFPNAEIKINNGDAAMFATKDIESREELTINYRALINHRANMGDLCQE